jgi:hypothetical protein
MGYQRPPRRFQLTGVWIEFLLIFVLIVLVVVIIIALFGPYFSNQITLFLSEIAKQTGK